MLFSVRLSYVSSCVTVVRDSVSFYACNFRGNLYSVLPFALEQTSGHGEGHACLKWWIARLYKGWGTNVAVEEIVWAGSECVWRASLDGRCSHIHA